MNNDTNWLPQPSVKSPEMDATITALTGIDRKQTIANKLCAWCANEVTFDSFKDELSLKEYHISAICQDCQDRVYG
jgi:hypothetical protein